MSSKTKSRKTDFIPIEPFGQLKVRVQRAKGNPALPDKVVKFWLIVSLDVDHDHFLPNFPVREALEEEFAGSIYSLREKVSEWLRNQLEEDGLTQRVLDVGSDLLTQLTSE